MTTATELEPRTDPSDRDRIRSGIRFCALVFLGLRLLVFAIGLVSVGPIPSHGAVSVPGWPPPGNGPGWSILFTAWERFDALWFLRIAASGYRAGDGSAAFFPAFPLVIRAVSFVLGGHPFAAGMLVSNLCFLGALIVLFFLTSSELSADAARRTVLYLAFFPTAYFFLMPYSEALFLLLAVTSYWGARRDRWWLAALAGALAAATRNVGIVLAPTLAVEAVRRSRESGRPAWPGVAAAAAVPLGLLAYLGYWWDRSGDLLGPIHQQASWERSPTWPWTTIARGTEYAFRFVGGDGGGYWMIDWLVVVPILLVSVYALFRLRASASIYLWGGLLIPLTFVFGDRPLMSMPRFVLPLFPAFWALADLAERYRIPRWAVIGVEAAGLGLLALMTVNWYYIF